MSFFAFAINPVPASRPRVSRWSTYYSKAYSAFRDEIRSIITEHPTWYPKLLLDCPLKVYVKFFRKIPESFSQSKKNELEGEYVVSNFDLDNLEKAIYDAMNGHFFVDDSQIVHHETSKHWSSNPRIEVTIETL